MNFERIYKYRFAGISNNKKLLTWKIISNFIYKKLNFPESIIDPAAGSCEFINQVPSAQRWAIDMQESIKDIIDPKIKLIIGNNLKVDLPDNYFDAVFISNFLEHLHNQEEVSFFLERVYKILKPGGKIAIMGPNFKYCAKEYFDFADHSVILTEVSVAEHLYGAGFNIDKIYPKFLPISFRSKLPVNDFLVKLYLKNPLIWKLVGKQFLLIARK